MESIKVSFMNRDAQRLSGILDIGSKRSKRCVVLCTHFTGYKELRHYFLLAKRIAEMGMCSLRFDYSDCIGESEGSCTDMRLSRQVMDTISALDYVVSKGYRRIGLFGHSLGGATAIVTAANDERVNALVSAAAPTRLGRDTFFNDNASEWQRTGFVTFSTWNKGDIRIPFDFYKDLEKYDATVLISRVHVPVLIIQPGQDIVVPSRGSIELYEKANEPKSIKVIEGSDHLFSSKAYEDMMVGLAAEWFDNWL
jgi:putative redox protein